MSQFTVKWLDRGREPQCPPDPAWPNGKDLTQGPGVAKTCRVELPYPAKRCGIYVVECSKCGVRVGITTAGRPDDPKSAEIACYATGIVNVHLRSDHPDYAPISTLGV